MEDAALAQKLLGHKSIAMTEAYIKQRQIDVAQPAKRRNKHGQ
jgi:integrase